MTDFSHKYPLPSRDNVTNKGDAGRVLVIGGDVGMCGAAAFSALSSYRMGCGLVDVYTHGENRIPMQVLVPEAVLSFWQNDEDLSRLNTLISRADAVLIGVGFGTGEIQGKILEHVILTCRVPLVIDADGLNLLAKNKQLLSKLRANTVLTPHLLELSRLTSETVSEIKKDVSASIKRAFSDKGVAVVAKSDKTHVLLNSGELEIISEGDSSLSTGGTGDVLAGMISSLLAQGADVDTAVSSAVYIHGKAGRYAGEMLGTRSVIARDVIDAIPHVLKQY